MSAIATSGPALPTPSQRADRARELERGEMRARIALLEGERRGNDNVRADLLRRVRMLEFALRGERCVEMPCRQ